MKIVRLIPVLQFLQDDDKNGDFMDMVEEYKNGELPLEIIKEVCMTTLNDIKYKRLLPEDIKDYSKLSSSDYADLVVVNYWITYVRNCI